MGKKDPGYICTMSREQCFREAQKCVRGAGGSKGRLFKLNRLKKRDAWRCDGKMYIAGTFFISYRNGRSYPRIFAHSSSYGWSNALFEW